MRPLGKTILVVSDIHYAGAAEKLRGDYELETASRPWSRALLRAHRHYVWKRDPFAHNHLLDRFVAAAETPEFVIANGDYSCDSAFVGVSDPAALASAHECLDPLRQRFGSSLLATIGDHELGKLSLLGRRGGLRLASWRAATRELGLVDFWQRDLGRTVLMGLNSTLVGLPLFEPDALPEELEEWRTLRRMHLATITTAFDQLQPDRRVLLFCHDPTALPFLWREPVVRARSAQIEMTVVGHLHSPLIFRLSQVLAGMPPIPCLGNAVRRMTGALSEATNWRPFKPHLCPALSGIELLKDGGYATIQMDPDSDVPARFTVVPLRWDCTGSNSGL